MAEKRLLLDSKLLKITISRLCEHLIENHPDFANTVLLGMQPRGIYLAERIKSKISKALNQDIPLGYLDTTFHRDDFRRRDQPLRPNQTKVPFVIEGQNVILIDDVLFTGRTVRAGLDAMLDFGRPSNVELLVLIDRRFSRELPVQPNYIGREVDVVKNETVKVEWSDQNIDNKVTLFSSASDE